MRSAQGSWQYPTYRRGSDAQAEDLGTKPREKGRGGGVWMSVQRSIGGLLPPRSSASAKGDNSPGGGAACSPGAAQPLTVDMGSLCHHFLPSQRAHSPQTQALPLSTDTGTRRPSGDKNTALHTCRTLPVASGLSKYLPKHLKELRRIMAYLSVQAMF